MEKNEFLESGNNKNNDHVFLMAHGAGAPMDSEWMEEITEQLAQRGIYSRRFEFPYMAERRETGKKRPPNTKKVLLETWQKAIAMHEEFKCIVVGGKSMGGRVASLICDDSDVQGLVVLGFPFHPPGKPPGDRVEHLEKLNTQTLFLQGERDALGTREEISDYKMSSKIRVSFLEDGDHSWKPRKKSGLSLQDNMSRAADEISDFILNKVCPNL